MNRVVMTPIVQADMFGASAVMGEEPRRARRRDPSTSHEAAERSREFIGDQCALVLATLKRFGKAGAEQIAGSIRLDAYAVRKRLSDLEHEGLAHPTESTRLTVSGRRERIWEAD